MREAVEIQMRRRKDAKGGQQGVWQLPEDVTWDVLLPRVSGVNH